MARIQCKENCGCLKCLKLTSSYLMAELIISFPGGKGNIARIFSQSDFNQGSITASGLLKSGKKGKNFDHK